MVGRIGIWLIMISLLGMFLNACNRNTEAAADPSRALAEESFAGIYLVLSEEAEDAGSSYDLETAARMVTRLGEMGYTAVDSSNQVDMAGTEKMLEFVRMAEKGEKGEVTVIVVDGSHDFLTYALETEDGGMSVTRTSHRMDKDGDFHPESSTCYPAGFWQYTEEGYLVLEGNSFSEEEFVLTLSNVPEHTAFRVQPLDGQCREFNREYVLFPGYGWNNLFLCNWNEGDYGELDFYDLFDLLYPRLYGQINPYAVREGPETEGIFKIPEEILEPVIMAYFDIDQETLRSKTTYLEEEGAYEYRPRGNDEAQYPEIPYPEVVDYTINQDGTIALTVNGVYPYENTSKAYSHKTVVRPLGEGRFQYVSNEMLPPGEKPDTWWRRDRLGAEEWKEHYQ